MNRVGVPRTSARRQSALDVPADTPQDASAGAVVVEPCDVEVELGRIPPQVVVLERLLAMEEQLVHVPEPVLERRGLGGSRRRQGVRVDLGQRKVPEGEADVTAQPRSTRSIARNACRE